MAMAEVENHFTVFVRLPFNRGDFVDPPPVAWSAAKERALWEIMSRQTKGNEVDWKLLASEFDVSQPFLLQQAAWLYERQLSQVRAQMRKVGSTSRHSATSSPAPGSASASVLGGYAMKRGGSGGSRVPSRLSLQARDSPAPRSDGSAPGTPVKTKSQIPYRASSGAISSPARAAVGIEAREASRPTSRQASKESNLPQHQAHGHRSNIQQPPSSRSTAGAVHNSSDSSDSDEDAAATVLNARRANPTSARYRSFAGRRSYVPSRNRQSEEEGDDDGDGSLPFLPFATTSAKPAAPLTPHQDPNATIRGGFGSSDHGYRPNNPRRSTMERVATRPTTQLPTLASSASSESSGPAPTTAPTRHDDSSSSSSNLVTAPSRPPGPISPRRAAELGLSPRRRPGGIGREGSDGTPSMGSSFSDLDDASVTQSALEEALMSNLGNGNGAGGMASRMSTISQALRSRYFDAHGPSGR